MFDVSSKARTLLLSGIDLFQIFLSILLGECPLPGNDETSQTSDEEYKDRRGPCHKTNYFLVQSKPNLKTVLLVNNYPSES